MSPRARVVLPLPRSPQRCIDRPGPQDRGEPRAERARRGFVRKVHVQRRYHAADGTWHDCDDAGPRGARRDDQSVGARPRFPGSRDRGRGSQPRRTRAGRVARGRLSRRDGLHAAPWRPPGAAGRSGAGDGARHQRADGLPARRRRRSGHAGRWRESVRVSLRARPRLPQGAAGAAPEARRSHRPRSARSAIGSSPTRRR